MTEFNWDFGSAPTDNPSTADTGNDFAALGFEIRETLPTPASAPAPSAAPTADAAPLTRRELLARERASTPPAPPAAQPTQTFVTPTIVMAQPIADSGRKAKAPKKPKALRPVKPPRGTSRPRKAAPTSVRPPAAASKRMPLKRKSFKRRLLSKLMTFGAMVGAGLMMVSTSLPANAFYSGNDLSTAEGAIAAPAEAKVQALMSQPAAQLSVTRDGYTTTSFREEIFLRYGNRNFFYTNDPNGTIQWPFAIAVPISDGYGPRVAPCPGCSTFHHGVDFIPGLGAHIQAIADGVVVGVDSGDWSYGEHVIIAHVINGVHVESLYAHMEVGSIKVKVGQEVKVGDELGLVGSTGESTGPHLHLEIHINGVPVDPFAWLKANAN